MKNLPLVFFVLVSMAGPGAALQAADAPGAVALDWLGRAAPAADDGVSWGVPWPKGRFQKGDALVLQTRAGASVPVQTWPLAYWPDGSIKWSGQAIAAVPEIGRAHV